MRVGVVTECQLGRLSVIHSCGIEALIAAMKIYHENLALHNMALLGLQHLSETSMNVVCIVYVVFNPMRLAYILIRLCRVIKMASQTLLVGSGFSSDID